MKTALLVSLFLTVTARDIPTPDSILFVLFEHDPAAALRFCAERPALHAGKGAATASDVDLTCEEIIDATFHDALEMPAMRDLGPSMIGALEKSPARQYLAKPYAALYRRRTAK